MLSESDCKNRNFKGLSFKIFLKQKFTLKAHIMFKREKILENNFVKINFKEIVSGQNKIL